MYSRNFAASNNTGVANFKTNNDVPSSLLELKVHKIIHPEVTFKETISVIQKPLDLYFKESNVDVNNYNGIVLDIQGAEL